MLAENGGLHRRCCYALWNLLQRVSAARYSVNEYEWIVLDKVGSQLQ